ncbi:MAG: aspartyl/asparaginyl beta-hydroxylase domain-containing protein [Gammaproteobacteria bacterium]|nr:aspartyl/asparaginyl beta-hydroxylase domain-containing protein [Gammaproteobacteria bacterium]
MIWGTIVLLTGVAIWHAEPRFYLYWLHKLAYRVDKKVRFISDISSYFPQHELVQSHCESIKRECLALLTIGAKVPKAHQVDKYNNAISSDQGPGWRTFYLKVYGGWFTENCDKCPQTYQLFKNMPNVTAVMFSIMEPGNRIPPHRGELKGIWRYQLPLVVPSTGTCAISVEEQTLEYQEGVGILFDDNLTHAVVNDSAEFRVVLFLDIQKHAPAAVKILDNFCMRLISLSPKFKRANVYLNQGGKFMA